MVLVLVLVLILVLFVCFVVYFVCFVCLFVSCCCVVYFFILTDGHVGMGYMIRRKHFSGFKTTITTMTIIKKQYGALIRIDRRTPVHQSATAPMHHVSHAVRERSKDTESRTDRCCSHHILQLQ